MTKAYIFKVYLYMNVFGCTRLNCIGSPDLYTGPRTIKFSALAVLLSTLVHSFGDVKDGEATFFQEDFAGDHNLSRAIWLAGIPVICRDIRDSRHLDWLSTLGFLITLQGLRHMARGGLAWFAPPCSSWIWLSRGSTRRSALNPRGARRYRKVREANKLCRRLIYLLEYLVAKGVFFAIEQPVTSLMWLYRPLRRSLKRWNVFEVCIPLGQYGASSETLG